MIHKSVDSTSSDAVEDGSISVVGSSTNGNLIIKVNAPRTYEVVAYTAHMGREVCRDNVKILVGGGLESLGIKLKDTSNELDSCLSFYVGKMSTAISA